jgi:integrase/recombinase XerD
VTKLAPVLQSFFADKLISQKHASPHTIGAYRDAWRLLTYAQQVTATPPWQLDLGQLDHDLITGFLRHLETDRGNTERTRNARLAAIHSLFKHAALRAPEDAATIQRVLAIEGSRTTRTDICWLTGPEADALLAAPDRATWIGRRDHAMIRTLLETGQRVSELTGLTRDDVRLTAGPRPYVHCTGKGRKERDTPVSKPAATVLRDWLTERAAIPGDSLFPTRAGTPLSRDAVQARLTKYRDIAVLTCPSLAGKKLTAHVLRHSRAMSLKRAGVDRTVIALWLGHEDIAYTEVYIHADLELKERALARTKPPDAPEGRYQPPDPILVYLESL